MVTARPIDWLADCAPNDTVAFRIGRSGDEIIAEWVDALKLVARRDGSAWRIETVDGADPRHVEKITRGGVQLLLRQLAGKPALHGAAVALDGRCVILLGRSGEGKSTLAAAICHQLGFVLLADDAVAVDTPPAPESAWMVSGLEKNHWLDGDARRALGLVASEEGDQKQPLAAARAHEESASLVAIVDLAFVDEPAPRLERIHGVDAMAAVIPQAVRFVLDDPVRNKLELDTLASLVEHVNVHRLSRPRSLDGDVLRATTKLILDLLQAPP